MKANSPTVDLLALNISITVAQVAPISSALRGRHRPLDPANHIGKMPLRAMLRGTSPVTMVQPLSAPIAEIAANSPMIGPGPLGQNLSTK